MALRRTPASRSNARKGILPMLLAASCAAIALPTAGFAVTGSAAPSLIAPAGGLATFTPANVDPRLAARVAERMRERGAALFTPAGSSTRSDRLVTVAVRVDDETAQAISVRSAIDSANAEPGLAPVRLASTRYNLGAARGYQSFAKPITPQVDLKKLDMPDLATYRPSQGIAPDKPGRLQPHIAFEGEGKTGRAPRTLEAMGEQSVDLGGSYRVLRNLDVTAGVRVKQDRDGLAPLTDGVQDSQAVYVGTQFRF